MGKLITPVQHELVLDGLNEIRPLHLQKDIKRVVSLPVLNQQPVGEIKIRGKLLRCRDLAVVSAPQQLHFDHGEFKENTYNSEQTLHQNVIYKLHCIYVEAKLKANANDVKLYLSDNNISQLWEFAKGVSYRFFLFSRYCYILWEVTGESPYGNFKSIGFSGGDLCYGR